MKMFFINIDPTSLAIAQMLNAIPDITMHLNNKEAVDEMFREMTSTENVIDIIKYENIFLHVKETLIQVSSQL